MSARACAKDQEEAGDTAGRAASGGIRLTRTAGALAGVSAVLLDQVSKATVFEIVQPGEGLVLAPMLSILPGWNEGMAFGLAQSTAPWLLIALALTISAWLAWLIVKTPSRIEAAGLGAAVGGSIANVADRIRFGAVRDFIDLNWNALHWPTFNAADIFVVGGLLLFAVADLHRQRKDREPAA